MLLRVVQKTQHMSKKTKQLSDRQFPLHTIAGWERDIESSKKINTVPRHMSTLLLAQVV